MIWVLAQQPGASMLGSELGGIANTSIAAVCVALLVWLITKAIPAQLDKSDAREEKARAHFEKILNAIEDRHAQTAQEGHEAAKQLSESLREQSHVIRENTSALQRIMGSPPSQSQSKS